MGLASALSTALTGLTAAETQIDVVGNNLANSQTVGFKASQAVFATQFLQTRSLGSAPGEGNGGSNPRQIGLGVQVAEITPDFTQGTIQVSNAASDMAIQGDGFFIVQGSGGEHLYTRNGIFKTNSENELVTSTGNRLLGFGVDEDFRIQTTTLQPLSIPLGAAAVAQATQNVFLEGTLSPSGALANTAAVVESATLGDAAVPRPAASGDVNGNGVLDPGEAPVLIGITPTPGVAGLAGSDALDPAGVHEFGDVVRYRFVFVEPTGQEATPSEAFEYTVSGSPADPTGRAITLNNLPSNGNYSHLRIYRAGAGEGTFQEVATLDMADTANPFVDNVAAADLGGPLNGDVLSGNYTYLITYHRAGEQESRPSERIGPINVVNGRVVLENLPVPPTPSVIGGFPEYDQIRIYRNLASDANTFYLVDTVPPGSHYIDDRTDAQISNLNVAGNKLLDADGPKISSNTLLLNVVRRDGLNFVPQFVEGELQFQGEKGGRKLTAQPFTITATTTVQELIDFMHNSLGIQTAADDPQNPIPGSVNNIPNESTTLSPGGLLNDGKIRFVSNNGLDNALGIGTTAFRIIRPDGTLFTPNLSFGTIQQAEGESAVTDFIVYDSLGSPINVRLTMSLESQSDTATTYRWFAESADNAPFEGIDITLGTGLVSFDGKGAFVNATRDTVIVDRRHSPALSPLEFTLDFSQMSGLETPTSTVSATRQDGFPTGKLSSFIVGEDGVIRGIFSNGATRDLGQVMLARFGNPNGLEQRGQNLFAAGVNSGLPVQGRPGADGIGSIIAGALELSNTDIGRNLIDLVLATTQYRGNSRVISTAQQLLDELLNLRR